MYIGLHMKCRLLLQIFMKPGFSRQIFQKNPQMSNFMKISPVGAGLFHADRQTDRRDEANSRSSANVPKKSSVNYILVNKPHE